MHSRLIAGARRMRPGLTLPELMVAIVVLGTLGALLLPRREPSRSRFTPEPAFTTPSVVVHEVEPTPAGPPGNLLVNGSFEAPGIQGRSYVTFGDAIPGWRVCQGTVDVKSTYWQNAPGQGRQSLDLVGSPGAGSIEQSFPTRPGREYLFTGWIAHNPVNPHVEEGRADVFLNGTLLTQLVHWDRAATCRAMRWRPFEERFRATSPVTTLAITDVTGRGANWGTALDGLAVVPVREEGHSEP